MRCQENTGFLVLHRCEQIAEFQCIRCSRKVCREHAVTSADGAPAAPAQAQAPSPLPTTPDAMLPPPPPPGTLEAGCLCQTCARERGQAAGPQHQGQNQGRLAGDDPYYRYPYYGGYAPYHTPYYYSHADRSAFDREPTSSSNSGEPDALGS